MAIDVLRGGPLAAGDAVAPLSIDERSSAVAGSFTLGNTDVQVVPVGTTVSGTVISGGEQDVYGSATVTEVDSGGLQVVELGGTASFTTVNNGGTQTVSAGGLATGSVANAGGEVDVWGSATFATVNVNGSLLIENGGFAGFTTVADSGDEYVYSGGTASGTTVGNNANEYVLLQRHRRRHHGDQRRHPDHEQRRHRHRYRRELGGVQYVYAGGEALFATLSGGAQDVAGGLASGTTVSSGGREYVYAGGLAASSVIAYRGEMAVFSGGSASSATVGSGGEAFVHDSGTIADTVVMNGGMEVVGPDGVANATTLQGGATLDLLALAYASGGTASVDPASDMLTVSVGGTSATLQLAASDVGARFTLSPDSGGGTEVAVALRTFAWSGASGSWSAGSNWAAVGDTTGSGPPSGSDVAEFGGGGGTIAGPGGGRGVRVR